MGLLAALTDRPKPRVVIPRDRRRKDFVGRLLLRRPHLVADDIMARAEKATGLSDWGDADFRLGLDRLVHALNTESDIPMGAAEFLAAYLVFMADRRLRTIATLRAHPEIEQTPVNAPIFIAGLPRTGSTLLQGLLAADPANRAMLHWETDALSPPPEPVHAHDDPRIGASRARLALFNEIAPDFNTVHFTEVDEPEECNAFFMRHFASMAFTAYFHVPSYEAWHFERDLEAAYRFHKQHLQILSWKFPQRRWVCKTPEHNLHLDALLKVYPDAHVLVPHRRPDQVLASGCSMIRYMRHIFSHGAHGTHKQVGRHQLQQAARGFARGMACRDRLPTAPFMDISYQQLVKDPLNQMAEVYRRLGTPFTEEVRGHMQAYLDGHRRHQYGKHRYSLEAFGLTSAAVLNATAGYMERFASMFVP